MTLTAMMTTMTDNDDNYNDDNYGDDNDSDDNNDNENDNNYRVAQNKPDYLLLLSKFCISTTKHASLIIYM